MRIDDQLYRQDGEGPLLHLGGTLVRRWGHRCGTAREGMWTVPIDNCVSSIVREMIDGQALWIFPIGSTANRIISP
jgi:hypothetical protein